MVLGAPLANERHLSIKEGVDAATARAPGIPVPCLQPKIPILPQQYTRDNCLMFSRAQRAVGFVATQIGVAQSLAGLLLPSQPYSAEGCSPEEDSEVIGAP